MRLLHSKFHQGRWTNLRIGSGPTGTERRRSFFLQFSFKLVDPRGGGGRGQAPAPPPAVVPSRPPAPPSSLPPPPKPPSSGPGVPPPPPRM